jgi:hypothetical protein
MRLPLAVVFCLASVASGATLVACFDLFHSTSGIVTACQLDAQACPTSDAGSTNFCSWSPQEARGYAEHACAWLGACESPMGRNAFGSCMFEALLAYDCTANPAHLVKGASHAQWDCLWQVQACADVDRCVYPGGVPSCGQTGDYTSCGNVEGGAAANRDVRVECTDGGRASGEDCALWGQTCAATGSLGQCAGSAGEAGIQCLTEACDGTRLHSCDGGDVGIDCADNGAQSCGGFPDPAAAQWVACIPDVDAGDGGDAGCVPNASAQCSNGYATSCPAGLTEGINCEEILQVPGASCTSGPLSPQFDWTSPCRVSPAVCTADSCVDTTITGCARGAPFTVDCSSLNLGACQMVTTDTGSQTHAACTVPQP